jgi:hypothetical protein
MSFRKMFLDQKKPSAGNQIIDCPILMRQRNLIATSVLKTVLCY